MNKKNEMPNLKNMKDVRSETPNYRTHGTTNKEIPSTQRTWKTFCEIKRFKITTIKSQQSWLKEGEARKSTDQNATARA